MKCHRLLATLLITIQGTMLASGQTPRAGPTQLILDTHGLVFETAQGSSFEARIVVPKEGQRNGWGVLLIGGGLGNDLNWTVPAFQDADGRKEQLTVSGEPNQEAPRLAQALAGRGFVAMHWSTIRHQDPNHNASPDKVTVQSPRDLLQQAQAALKALRSQRFCDVRRVVLLGHSLGAVRAANLADTDGRIAGLVLLAPAQLTRTAAEDRGRNMNREVAAQLLGSADTDVNGACSRAEFQIWQESATQTVRRKGIESFDQLDFDRDGSLMQWELSAGVARANRRHLRVPPAGTDASGLLWTEDLLRKHTTPTLIIYGGLDNSQAHHAPIIAEIKMEESLDHVALEILPRLGHQLGREENGRLAPIDEQALSLIGQWLERQLAVSRDCR